MIPLFLFYMAATYSTRGPNPRDQARWRPRSRRRDWRTFPGYGQGMRSKSCWTCKGTSRRNLHSFLANIGCYNRNDDRWFTDIFRVQRTYQRWLPWLFGDFTLVSVAVTGLSVLMMLELWLCYGEQRVDGPIDIPGGLDDQVSDRDAPSASDAERFHPRVSFHGNAVAKP